MGVTATIINGTAGAQLILSGAEGLDNEISLSSSVGSLSSLLSETRPALNAEFTINGIAASSSTNKASVLDGITLDLSQTGSSNFTVVADFQEKMSASLESFIKSYNDANTLMRSLGSYNTTTKVAGALQGSSLLRDLQNSTRGLVFNTTLGGSSALQRLSDIGVAVATDGSLSLDKAKLASALANSPTDVANLVSKVGTEFNSAIERFTGSNGTIKIASDSADGMLKELSKRSEVLERRLEIIETRYRKRFTALDSLISNMTSTSSFLSQQLAGISAQRNN